MSRERIIYIDKLRGLAIFFVVLGHIMESMRLSSNIILDFIYSFHMPLFFFISGFLVNNNINDKKTLFSFMLKKTQTLMIPFFIWIGLFSLYVANSYYDSLFHHSKMGYWFLQTLFELFLLNSCLQYLFSKIKIDKYKNDLFIIILIVMQLFLLMLDNYSNKNINNLLCIHHVNSFWLFFNLGIILNNYKYIHVNILKERNIAIYGIMFIMMMYIQNIHESFILKILIKFVAVLFFYTTFRIYVSSSKYTILSYIGKRSMEIYVLHYFLLRGIDQIWKIIGLNDKYPIVIILLLGLTVSIFIIYINIIVTNFISQNKYYSLFLFGRKNVIIRNCSSL